jgi:dihydroxyacid dehydratase/phosphogluconate dehydratase
MTDAYDWSQSLSAAVQEGITLPTAQTTAETRAAAVAASGLNDCNFTATAISSNAAAEALNFTMPNCNRI